MPLALGHPVLLLACWSDTRGLCSIILLRAANPPKPCRTVQGMQRGLQSLAGLCLPAMHLTTKPCRSCHQLGAWLCRL